MAWLFAFFEKSVLALCHRVGIDCSDGDVRDFIPVLEERSRDFLSVAQADLVQVLQQGIPGESLKSDDLKEARALFLCSCDQCCEDDDEKVHGYPSILDHWLENHQLSSWDPNKFSIRSGRLLVEVAEDVLAALGLAKNCSKEEVENLGKLVCRCSYWHCLEPMEFSRLVRIHGEFALWSLIEQFMIKVQHVVYSRSSYRETLERVPPIKCVLPTRACAPLILRPWTNLYG